MSSQSAAHLFFSYAHDDAGRLTPLHAQMQNALERNLWLDKVGLERGVAWENAIKGAIDDSYGVIFAVTKTFVTRKFILEKEIPWALDKFKDKQGAQIFPILFDDVDLPDDLKTPHITHLIDARDGDMVRIFEELKRVLPEPQVGTQPFIVDWPRLTNFKGRDNQLIELHNKLMGDGRVGVKTAGLHGMGGIGKTQLAVEYAHRYRYHYPGGVYWLNAGADWRKETVVCADRLGLTPIDPSDSDRDKQMTLAFQKYLTAQGKDALLVLDNVDDPAEVIQREIAPKLTLADLAAQTRTRLLLTTRVQKLPEGFADVSVNILSSLDARAVLLDAWISGGRKDAPDTLNLDAIAQALGYLPLGLILATATLTKKPTLTPASLLDHLRKSGIDQIADKVGLEKENAKTKYISRVDVALEWQIGQLEKGDSRTLLALLAAFGEAAIVPSERLRLLTGLMDDEWDTPFADAVDELTDYHLIEPLSEGTAFRLHPLVQAYGVRTLDGATRLTEAVPRLVAAYRDPTTLDAQTRMRGFGTVIEDFSATKRLFKLVNRDLEAFIRLLTLEGHHLLKLPEAMQAGYVIQQVRERTYHEGDDALAQASDEWLLGKRHFRHSGLRYPLNKGMLQKLSGHSADVNGALELKDGRLLSWSRDNTLRLWSMNGEALYSLSGHSADVNGALELKDGRLLSWSRDSTLRLWSGSGEALTTFEGHRSFVMGALELRDGRLLSWSGDKTLRLWSGNGEALTTFEGHRSFVLGAIELRDGRILSWLGDSTLRLLSSTGELLATLSGHSGEVVGVLELSNGQLVSWSDDSTLRLLSSTGELLATLSGHSRKVNGVLELEDRSLLSWSLDKTLRLWSENGKALATLAGHSDFVFGAMELRDERLLSWSYDHTLRLWSGSGEALATLNGHSNYVQGALELRDGRLLSWSNEITLRLWNGSGEGVDKLSGHSDAVKGVMELRDGRLLSRSDDSTLRLWSRSGELLATLSEHSRAVYGAMEFEDGRLLSWSRDNTLRLWSGSGEALATLAGHSDFVFGAIRLEDGRLLSWSRDNTLRLWSGSGEALYSLSGHSDYVMGALELRDGRLLSWSDDSTLRLWNGSGEALAILSGHSGEVVGVLELRDGWLLSWSADSTLRLWSGSGEALATLSGHSMSVSRALELRDGRLLSWSADSTLRLWSRSGELLATLNEHIRNIRGATELGNGRLLSWSTDETLRLWRSTGEVLAVYATDSMITCCVVTKDGRIVIGDEGGRVLFLTLYEGE